MTSKPVSLLTPEELAAKRAYDARYNATRRDTTSPTQRAAQHAAQQRYREAHRDQRRQADREYSTRNSKKKSQATKAWNQANRERYLANRRAIFHRRKARLQGAEGTWTARQFAALCKRNGWRCTYCGTMTLSLQPDHMTPLARGGSNHLDNITPACPRCNKRKHTKTAEEFSLWLERYGY